ncbi:MAG: hypothetical protein MJ240_04550 [Kiritimatiellae bacterium]|nr:hypothetical protein [Kiritimatiellia bacterium]
MRRLLALFLCGASVVGCVSVKNEHALVPPTGLSSDFKAPLIVPKGPVPCTNLKVGVGSRSVYVKDWVYTGIGAEICNMALADAVAKGQIKHLYFADYSQYSILGFVTVFTVTAYGD